jgi:hypothetical protein
LLLPSLEALIITLPAPMALIAPAASTVATVTSELSQVTCRPESEFPLESCNTAVASAVWPMRIADGLIVTEIVAIEAGNAGVTAMVA